LSLTMSVASNYMLRLLRLSATVGNIERAVGLEEFIDNTVGVFLRDFGEHIDIETDFDEGELEDLELPHGLTFIVSYLLENALEQYQLQYGRDFRGKIYFKINREEKILEVSVIDEAGGIPEDILPKIFDRTFTTKPHGTGHGLFWAKELIGMFDGDITARNEEQGACFRVTLPIGWQEITEEKRRVPDTLVERVFHILRERRIAEADELAEPIAREIYTYSSRIAEITRTRESISYDPYHETDAKFIRYKIEDMLNYYFQATCTGGPEHFKAIVFERGVTQEDIENLLLSLLVLDRVETKEDVAFRYLLERQAVMIEYTSERHEQILLRSKENLLREKEDITLEGRREYQRLLRQIGYSIHKLGGTIGFMRVTFQLLETTEIPEQKREQLLSLYDDQEVPHDIYDMIHLYTASLEGLTGFEDDILIVERVDGWQGAVSDLVRAFRNLKQRLDQELQGIELADVDKRRMERMKRVVDEAQILLHLLNREKVEDKEIIDITSRLDDEYSILSELPQRFHLTVVPGTRLWLKMFLLDNIMLNIFRCKTKGEDLYVTVSEENGHTVFNMRYKGQVNPETMFEPKRQGEPWYRGPLVLDLIDAGDGDITAENVGENVEITVRFLLPNEDASRPVKMEDIQVLSGKNIIDNNKELGSQWLPTTGILANKQIAVVARDVEEYEELKYLQDYEDRVHVQVVNVGPEDVTRLKLEPYQILTLEPREASALLNEVILYGLNGIQLDVMKEVDESTQETIWTNV
ncbi:ATP-binding protein, partial [bacterium]|nr:ATP-binding protein [bacterium]